MHDKYIVHYKTGSYVLSASKYLGSVNLPVNLNLGFFSSIWKGVGMKKMLRELF